MSNARLVIEYPSAGKTYHHDEYGVYRYDTYPRGSVLAGQERRSFVNRYPTLKEAQEAHPEAEWSGGGSGYREVFIPHTPPSWFDQDNAGEHWDDEDY